MGVIVPGVEVVREDAEPQTRRITRQHGDCDGCSYRIGAPGVPRTVLIIPVTDGYGPPDSSPLRQLEFEFHAPTAREHDCFRYWSTSQHMMKRSLEARGWTGDEIDEFLATHLYRGSVV